MGVLPMRRQKDVSIDGGPDIPSYRIDDASLGLGFNLDMFLEVMSSNESPVGLHQDWP